MRLCLVLIVSLVLPSLSFGQLGGTSVFNGLNIQPSARVAAMGGAINAVVDSDIQLAAINPSLIDSAMSGSVMLSYVDYFAKTNFGNAAYARHINSKWNAAASLLFIAHGAMDQYDALGNNIGSFNAGEYALSLGASYKVDSLWTVGLNQKTFYANIAEYNSVALAFDFAATYHKPSKGFTAAFLVRNVGAQLKTFTPGTREKLPFEFQIGITKKPKYAPIRFSLVAENLQQWDLSYVNPNEANAVDPITGELINDRKFQFGDLLMRHIVMGAEFLLGENIQIRGAYNYRRRQELGLTDRPGMAGFSFGMGLRIKKFHLSYARAIYHLAGPANHFSLVFKV
jgi:hypothetical protein